jgi:hypothetical protein
VTHDNVRHIDLGEWYLRQAIKHTVANDGHTDILEISCGVMPFERSETIGRAQRGNNVARADGPTSSWQRL